VTKPKPGWKHPVKPQQIGKSSVVGIQRKLKPKTEVTIGKFAISQKEKQSVSPGHIKVMLPASDRPDPKPAAGNAYGQFSCTAAGNFALLHIRVSTSFLASWMKWKYPIPQTCSPIVICKVYCHLSRQFFFQQLWAVWWFSFRLWLPQYQVDCFLWESQFNSMLFPLVGKFKLLKVLLEYP
jgi:hypothetical protein